MTVEEELDKLEDGIRRLKIEYEAYFNGGSPRPPRDTVFRVETAIRKCGSEMGSLNFGQRFRFNQLAQKYAVYNDLWRKKLQQKEEGRGRAGARRSVEERDKEKTAAAEPPFCVVCSDPERESDKVGELLQALVRAKHQIGADAGEIKPEVFAKFVSEKARQIKQRLGCERIRFSVTVEEGKVRLKAGKATES